MPYDVQRWPNGVYPGELEDECPEARETIDVFILQMRRHGPSPAGYDVKTLGKKLDGLWQLSLKVKKRQVRVLYAPYGAAIVIFRIHKKGSPQEQQRAYRKAMVRKREYEEAKRFAERSSNDGNCTIH
jgi:hypothetical protein